MILEDETKAIMNCAFEVGNTLGHGLMEKVYENALIVEFNQRGIPAAQQQSFDVLYKNVKVGTYIPDLIVFGSVVVDTKTIERITDNEVGQMLNYLKITGLNVGLIINFKHSKISWKRVIQS